MDKIDLIQQFLEGDSEFRKYVENRQQLMSIDVSETDFLLGQLSHLFATECVTNLD